MTKRYPRDKRTSEELFPDLVAVLLGGWAASVPAPAADDDKFRIFAYQDRDLASLWVTHESALRAAARRLRIRPIHEIDGAPAFFGESLVARQARGEKL
jgi:hypothetical protein